jgi:hypothetical protein
MAKGGSGAKMLYFVLYVVLITELLIVITERDELEESEMFIRNNMLGSIAASYKAPISLSSTPKFLDYNVAGEGGHEATIVLSVTGLVSDEEKAGVVYYVNVAPGSKTPDAWPSGGISSEKGNGKYKLVKSEDGAAKFLATMSAEGDYKFSTYCEVERRWPGYLMGTPLLDSLKVMVGNLKKAKSNIEIFTISAKRQGGVKKKGAELVL